MRRKLSNICVVLFLSFMQLSLGTLLFCMVTNNLKAANLGLGLLIVGFMFAILGFFLTIPDLL